MKEQVNEAVRPLFTIIDKENGTGYNKNISSKGYIVKMPKSNTQMLYTVKFVPVDGTDLKILKINYIHYDNKKELLNLLAWTVKWWTALKPNIIIYREKDRHDKTIDQMLRKCGFLAHKIHPHLHEFDCKIDGWPCDCNVYELMAYSKLTDN